MDWKGRKVLVTGGGGFIGSHLVEALLERGAEVTAFVRYTSRGSAGFLDPIAENIRIVANDITEFDGVRQAIENQDSVFHLAALIGIPFSFEHPWEVVQVNTMGTLNILSAARQTGPRRVILTSTSEVYGTAQYVPIDEVRSEGDARTRYEETVSGGGIQVRLVWEELGEAKALELPPSLTGVKDRELFTVLIESRKASIIVDGKALKGELGKRVQAGLETTTAFLYFAETWIWPEA